MRVKFVLSFLLIGLLASTANARAILVVSSMSYVPPTAHLEKYPIEKGPLSVAEIANLGLRPVVLDSPWTGYNYYRKLRGGRWVLETIPAGTLVLENASGPVYKAGCGNRLAALRKCPIAPTVPGFWSRLWTRYPLLRIFFEVLGILLAIIAGLVALLATLWVLQRVFHELTHPPRRDRTDPLAAHPTGPDDGVLPETRYFHYYEGENGGADEMYFAGHRGIEVIHHPDGGGITVHMLR